MKKTVRTIEISWEEASHIRIQNRNVATKEVESDSVRGFDLDTAIVREELEEAADLSKPKNL